MKKRVLFVLIASMVSVLVFAGCGSKNDAENASDTAAQETATEAEPEEDKAEDKAEEVTLESYFAENPDVWESFSSSIKVSEGMDCSVSGNELTISYIIDGITVSDLDEAQLKTIQDQIDQGVESQKEAFSSGADVLSQETGVNVEDIKVIIVYTDETGAEIHRLEV